MINRKVLAVAIIIALVLSIFNIAGLAVSAGANNNDNIAIIQSD